MRYNQGTKKIKICKTLTIPMATYGAESWCLNKTIAKRLASFTNISKRMFGGFKVNGYWRKRYSKELKQLFGDLDTLSFVSIRRLNCFGHINGMNSTRKVSQVFDNNPQGRRLKVLLKSRRWNCVQTDINS